MSKPPSWKQEANRIDECINIEVREMSRHMSVSPILISAYRAAVQAVHQDGILVRVTLTSILDVAIVDPITKLLASLIDLTNTRVATVQHFQKGAPILLELKNGSAIEFVCDFKGGELL